ncbi:MAG: transglutaminase-like domain-containing protein [Victivallaceae bacterium]
MDKFDLTSFLARGFGKEHDALIANVPVEGMDKYHTYSQIRLAPETEKYLYEEYTSTQVKYYKGSRPLLEKIIDNLHLGNIKSDKEKVIIILQWVAFNIRHAFYVKHEHETPGNRGFSEEELIMSGWGWCNEKARIFVSLAQIAGFPARMCGIFHSDKIHAHMAAEVYVDNKWSFCDPTCATVISYYVLDSWASAKDLPWNENMRNRIDNTYRKNRYKMSKIHGNGKSHVETIFFKDNPYKMFHQVGITNYPIFTFPIASEGI